MKVVSSQHLKEAKKEASPNDSTESYRSSISERRSSAGQLATKNGMKVEKTVRDIYNFKKFNPHSKTSQPDIFDPDKHVFGEIKMTMEKTRILLYTDQIRRYLKLEDDMNKQRSLDRGEIHMSVYFFVVFVEKKNSDLLRDVYVLGKEELHGILKNSLSKEQKTRWRLQAKAPKLLAKIDDLENEDQTLFSVKQEAAIEKAASIKGELRSGLLKKNDKGAWVRLNCSDLDKLCPSPLPRDYKGMPIIFHYSAPMPEFAWNTDLKKAAKVKRI